MKISKRLLSLCELVDKGSVVADIGCDHAQLCCYLVKEKIVSKAYACDVKEGPLLQAKKNIEAHQLQNYITTVLSDGLHKIENDVQVIVIAGMGFETIKKILENDFDKLQGKTLIIQSNRDVPKLRSWLQLHEFAIIKEKTIYDESHYYQMIKVDTTQQTKLSEQQLYLGYQMVKDECYYDSLRFQENKLCFILKELKKDNERYAMFKQQLEMIQTELESN